VKGKPSLSSSGMQASKAFVSARVEHAVHNHPVSGP
jgi:hypothetical protein